MKKSQLLIVLAVIVTAVFIYTRVEKNRSKKEAAEESAKTSANFSLQTAVTQKIDAPVEDNEVYKSKAANCQDTLQFFLKNDMDTIHKNVSSLDAEDEKCLKEELSDLGIGDLQACKMDQNVEEHKAKCLTELVRARSTLVDRVYANFDNYQGMDLNILSNRIFSKINRMSSLTPEEIQELKEMTQALMERNPGSINALKLRMMGEFAEKDSILKSPVVEDLARRGLDMDPKDSGLAEVLLLRESEKPGGEDFIKEFAQRNPDRSQSYYWLANMEWKKKNRAGTIELLERCLSMDPKEPRYRVTLEGVKTHAPGTPGLFQFSMGASMDNL